MIKKVQLKFSLFLSLPFSPPFQITLQRCCLCCACRIRFLGCRRTKVCMDCILLFESQPVHLEKKKEKKTTKKKKKKTKKKKKKKPFSHHRSASPPPFVSFSLTFLPFFFSFFIFLYTATFRLISTMTREGKSDSEWTV